MPHGVAGRRASGYDAAMDLREAIASRRTVHDYRDAPLPEGALERALSAALSAPNHRMTEPWRFVRVGPEARARLVEISADLKNKDGKTPLTQGALDKLRAKLLSPAELIALCQVRQENSEISREDYAAVACAAYAAMLALWSEGIGSKWTTGGVTRDERTYSLLGVDPVKEEVVGFLLAGYPLAEAPKPRRRRTLGDVLRSVP